MQTTKAHTTDFWEGVYKDLSRSGHPGSKRPKPSRNQRKARKRAQRAARRGNR